MPLTFVWWISDTVSDMKKHHSISRRFSGTGRPIQGCGRTIFMSACAAVAFPSCSRSGLTTPASHRRERENSCGKTTYVPRFLMSNLTKMDMPDCTPGYKICEWNDDRRRHNSPVVINQREVWILDRPSEDRARSADVDDSFLDSLTSSSLP